MKALTTEWLQKADEDYRVCRREIAVRRGASLDAVCFHSQQCAEKHLKAALHEWGIVFAKTHDLEALIQQCIARDAKFSALLGAAKVLVSHAVEVRYPGSWATRTDAESALKTAQSIRRLVRQVLGVTRRRAAKKSAKQRARKKRS